MRMLFLTRHAQSVANLEGWVSGQSEPGLTPKGVEQAVALAAALKDTGEDFGGIYASDLSRTRRTADIVGRRLGLDVVTDPGLRERNYGEWTGTLYNEAFETNRQAWERIRTEEHAAPPGGETIAEMRKRVLAGMRRAAEQWPGKPTVVVAHRGCIWLLIRTWELKEDGRLVLPPDPPDWLEIPAEVALKVTV